MAAISSLPVLSLSARPASWLSPTAALSYKIKPFHQTADFEKALVNARSVTTLIFDRRSGGAQHCQAGKLTLVYAAVFDWAP
jgi:hypothetical protein